MTWTQPYDHKTAITAYVVKFQGADLNYYLELIDCDASETVIFNARTCTVPTARLMAAPFNIPWGTDVTVDVRA